VADLGLLPRVVPSSMVRLPSFGLLLLLLPLLLLLLLLPLL
jgi:hypothetical protein